MSTKKLSTSRRTLLKGTAASAAIAPFFIGRSAKAADTIVVKVATVAPRDTFWGRLASKFSKHVEKRSAGAIDVKTFFGGALGSEQAAAEMALLGKVEIYAGSMGGASQIVPELAAFELPYLMSSRKVGQKALVANRTLVHDIMWDAGFKLVMFSENGMQDIGVNRPVEKPSDLKGLKIRALESQVHMDTIKSWGASASPMGTTEVLPSLQTGVIDGFTNTALFALAAAWLTGVTHWTVSQHCYQPAVVAISRKFWEGLAPELQEAFGLESEEVEKMQKRGFVGLDAMESQLRQNIVDLGIELHEPDLEPWRKLAPAVHKEFRKQTTKQGKALLDAILKSV